jgi:hypothetical protein
MAQYYPDVADSIPELIVAAGTQLLGETIQCETIEEAYIKAKQIKRFGETIDV